MDQRGIDFWQGKEEEIRLYDDLDLSISLDDCIE